MESNPRTKVKLSDKKHCNILRVTGGKSVSLHMRERDTRK